MKFKLTHGTGSKAETFSEDAAPDWLYRGGVPGSTMDNRWFWEGYVLTLQVGESVETDFSTITRIE